MNISSIKNKAEQLLMGCKPQVIRIMTIMMLIGLIPSLFSGDNNSLVSLISFILSILFLTFRHGYIVTTLKVVRNNAQAITDDDALVGFKRFKELFPTYLVAGIIMFAIAFGLIMLAMFIFTMLFGSTLMNIPSVIFNTALSQENIFSSLTMLLQVAPTLIFGILLAVLIVIIVMSIVSIYLFAMPYLLEQYNMRASVALKESFSFMKSHIWDMIKLELSFIGWIFLAAIIEGVFIQIFMFIPILGGLLASIAGGLFSIYTYLPKYMVAQAVFFEELAYYRYDQTHTTQQGEMNNA